MNGGGMPGIGSGIPPFLCLWNGGNAVETVAIELFSELR